MIEGLDPNDRLGSTSRSEVACPFADGSLFSGFDIWRRDFARDHDLRGEKKRRDFTSSRAIIIACKPYDWIKEFPKTNIASAELRKKTLEKWKELFH